MSLLSVFIPYARARLFIHVPITLPGTASKKEASATKTENQIILGLDMADWRALSAGREHGAIPFRGGAEQT